MSELEIIHFEQNWAVTPTLFLCYNLWFNQILANIANIGKHWQTLQTLENIGKMHEEEIRAEDIQVELTLKSWSLPVL